MENTLKMLKLDLGISHKARDEFFCFMIESCQTQLSERGIKLDMTKTDDIMLLSDYAAWTYRKRMENIPMSQNLMVRIRNRQTKARANIG